MKWDYDNAIERFPVALNKKITLTDGSILMARDIIEGVPEFMHDADLIFTDGPWNAGNIRAFYTKADESIAPRFDVFQEALFKAIREINPRLCFLEIGKEFVGEYLIEMKRIFRSVTLYNSTYYHKKSNICYVIQGAAKKKNLHLDGTDEEDIISSIAANCEYDVIGDLCMGRGLVALTAARNKKRFVGTELNPKRLAVTLERLQELGVVRDERE